VHILRIAKVGVEELRHNRITVLSLLHVFWFFRKSHKGWEVSPFYPNVAVDLSDRCIDRDHGGIANIEVALIA
jgi:hypothetical protein